MSESALFTKLEPAARNAFRLISSEVHLIAAKYSDSRSLSTSGSSSPSRVTSLLHAIGGLRGGFCCIGTAGLSRVPSGAVQAFGEHSIELGTVEIVVMLRPGGLRLNLCPAGQEEVEQRSVPAKSVIP